VLGPARTGRLSLLDPHKPQLRARLNEGVTTKNGINVMVSKMSPADTTVS
jgi:hypothetical protein